MRTAFETASAYLMAFGWAIVHAWACPRSSQTQSLYFSSFVYTNSSEPQRNIVTQFHWNIARQCSPNSVLESNGKTFIGFVCVVAISTKSAFSPPSSRLWSHTKWLYKGKNTEGTFLLTWTWHFLWAWKGLPRRPDPSHQSSPSHTNSPTFQCSDNRPVRLHSVNTSPLSQGYKV